MMKTLSTLLILLLTATTGLAQNQKDMIATITDKQEIQEVVTAVFTGTDEREWKKVEASFASEVLLDYTSMAGGQPLRLTPKEITDSWKTILPGFEYTQHAINNFDIDVTGNQARVLHYGNAEHYLDVADAENIWTVVGTYEHRLIHTEEGWKVDQMKFNLKYMDGNMDLPRLAKEKLQQQ